jgi:transcriptional regulator with XRE-family HTH domain
MGSDHGSHPGDLGRRVRHRREELGLTRAELAGRAGIDEKVVIFIEEEPAAVGAETVLRLAYALDLPDFSLLGSDADVPPQFEGHHPGLDVLAVPECWRLLDDHGVGRIAFLAEPGEPPRVHPMNYAVRERCLVLRVRLGGLLDSALGRYPQGCPASFEVDHIDDAQHEGWSVLLLGIAMPEAGNGSADIEPWAGGVAVRSVRLTPSAVTGRRIFVD